MNTPAFQQISDRTLADMRKDAAKVAYDETCAIETQALAAIALKAIDDEIARRGKSVRS